MRIAGVRIGDLVHVRDSDRSYIALVIGKPRRRSALRVQPLRTGHEPPAARDVNARIVTAHWRKAPA